MEVLEIQRIIPDLVIGGAVKEHLPDFELNHKHDWTNNQDRIHSPSHSRDVEFQEQGSIDTI